MAARKDEWGLTPLSQVRAQARYDKDHTTGFYLKLNLKTDLDIIKWLNRQKNKQGALKQLIRKELETKKSDT